MEEVKPDGRFNGHHPCGWIRHQKEVGLRATGTGVGTGMVGGWTTGFLFLALANTNLVTGHVMSHHPMGALLTPMEGQTIHDLNHQGLGAGGHVTPFLGVVPGVQLTLGVRTRGCRTRFLAGTCGCHVINFSTLVTITSEGRETILNQGQKINAGKVGKGGGRSLGILSMLRRGPMAIVLQILIAFFAEPANGAICEVLPLQVLGCITLLHGSNKLEGGIQLCFQVA